MRAFALALLALVCVVCASLVLFWGFIRADNAAITFGCIIVAALLAYVGMWAWETKGE